jgi:hypothetical protein
MPQNNEFKTAKTNKIDWGVFKWSLVTLLLAIIIGGILIIGGQQYQQYWVARIPEEEGRAAAIKQKLQKAQAASEIVGRGDLKLYDELIAEGFFQKDQTLSTKEQFILLTQEFKNFLFTILAEEPFSGIKPKLEFSGTDQIPYPVEQFGITPELKVYGTPLQFEIELLHDGDVLKLLQAFQTRPSVGFIKFRRCEVERLRKTDVGTTQPHLKLKCLLIWYTARIEKTTEKDQEKSGVKKKP